ncbi:MAG: Carboxypeptidase regulatory-like domain [Thermoplasmata archaeon]|nr:Carboxypeptidase regulatory-like domain [Thermoplasmata archaeon]
MALLLAALFVAGCSSKAADRPEADGLRATPTTGIIRGVVVDAAIRPLAGVHVVLPGTGGSPARSTSTNDLGLFGFESVQPGGHLLRITRLGYAEAQQAAQVEAGVSDPAPLRVQLVTLSGAAPYAQAFKFSGFLECALSVVALCAVFNGPTCGQPNLPCTQNVSNDNFATIVPIDHPPQRIQSEMVWQTTTSASDQLWLWHSKARRADGTYNGSCACWAQGKSPLLLATNESRAAEQDYGSWNNLELRVFTGSIEGTRNPLDPNGCYPATPSVPMVGSAQYCGGAGFSVEQGFTIYTHVFYGYLPPDGWRFTEQMDVPPPA